MNKYLDPEDEAQDKRKVGKSDKPSGNKKPGGSLEKNGPVKDKDYKVLHKDGSFADSPYNNEPGGGALEGTVGSGT